MVQTLVALGVFVMSTFPYIKLTHGQSDQVLKTVITNSDPQITYSPDFCSGSSINSCFGAWWDTPMENSSVIKTTVGPSTRYQNLQTTLSYSFYGSSVEVYGLADPQGANTIIQIDNFLAIVNTSTGMGGAALEPHMIHNHSQLSPQMIHTLSVGWSGNMNPNPDAGGYYPLSYVYFDRLVIGDFRAVNAISSTSSSAVISSSAASSAASGTATTQTTSAKLSPGALAGIIISILAVIMLCSLSFCFLRPYRRRLFRRPRRPTPGVTVTIESLETYDEGRDPSPTEIENWKAHPHMSLPPAYVYSSADGPEKAGYGDEKGVSYLDLESGETKSTAGSSTTWSDSSPDQKKRKSRLSILPTSSSSTRSSSASRPPRAKLRVNTRESALAPRRHPFSADATSCTQDEPDSPITPFTPYCVGTATVARPQNAQLVSQSSLGSGDFFPSKQSPPPPMPPLPPVPSASEEKSRLAKHFASFRRSRKVSRSRTREVTVDSAAQRHRNTLEVELNAIASSSRPSFDSMSVMTRSVPPPYTLHG